jgi:HPt (histidine-containing phosphotransfer) domain-containing protein
MPCRKSNRLDSLRAEFIVTFGETRAQLRAFTLALGVAHDPTALAAAIRNLAHDINGSAGLLGLRDIAAVASVLEHAAISAAQEGASAAALVCACTRLEEALREDRHGLKRRRPRGKA